jgi:hypothetical protein
MKPFDEELKNALRRVEPPDGFAERVMARTRTEARPARGLAERLRGLFRPWPVRWATALAVTCLLLVIGTSTYQKHEQRRIEGEMAGKQARLALRIASAKLNAALRDAAQPSRHNLEN